MNLVLKSGIRKTFDLKTHLKQKTQRKKAAKIARKIYISASFSSLLDFSVLAKIDKPKKSQHFQPAKKNFNAIKLWQKK